MTANGGPDPDGDLRLRLIRLCWEADGVLSLTLTDPHGRPLPDWRPGAHLRLTLPTGVERHYSLCGDPADTGAYRIAVLHEPRGRGGSEYIHRFLRPGAIVAAGRPRNNFPLLPAARYLFVAGGIGITPVLPMLREAHHRGTPWQLLYGGRSRASMAFLGELAPHGRRVRISARDEHGALPLTDTLDAACPAPGAEPLAVYCCGPEGLLDALTGYCAGRDGLRAHVERFKPPVAPARTDDKPVEVRCVRSGTTVQVPADESVLDALLTAGAKVHGSCREGVCGSCEVTVRAGTPDHRDHILDAAERDTAQVMYPCVSRSLTPVLELDL
ncbi:2Fe-2S iron-sulfur cluster binding domain-containing protein [Streptomyces sp. SID4919]|uniref:PDR/VanB family oxidoreductase n=1 Tax=unclassified Streptomyces TaxID=2593676 RepID=UPI000823886F|nr:MULTISPECIES: PDR/VanB family oxidoreductase [unclassified Streptomyces]MYY07974.1 2Fe-2S iron-sulfur cluster binding domain-containing protein [Streptomyces sp. SID4919]SCK07595.1 Ferredoxin-NADP reductase [Streptomyces sp. AmelKG-E11A]